MIQANELRIGNLVTDEWYESFKTVITVDSINTKGIDLFIEDDGNWTELAKTWIDAEMPFDELRGIPLDEEWLLKFGFERVNIHGYISYDLDTIEILLDQGIYKLLGIGIDVNIKHIHQLQNLYFSLTGKELTIK